MIEIITRRTQNGKIFDLGNGRKRLETHVGAIHYKDNYSSSNEQWKDIDLTWKDNRIAKAPYELTRDGQKITIRDKKTGEVSTCELLENSSTDLKWEIVPRNDKVSFRHILSADKLPFEARFRIEGKIPFIGRASDDRGELELETTFEHGILTEKLSQVKDKLTGQARLTVGDIRIDPTFYPGQNTDDCWVRGSNEAWLTSAVGIPVGDYNSSNWDYQGAVRFLDIDIPQGSDISVAYLRLTAATIYNGIGETIFEGEDIDTAATFSTFVDYDNRVRTSENASWTPSVWVLGTTYNSSSIVNIIEAITGRGGWEPGNDLVLFWRDDTPGWGGTQTLIEAASWNHASYDPPALYIEFGEPFSSSSSSGSSFSSSSSNSSSSSSQSYSSSSSSSSKSSSSSSQSYSSSSSSSSISSSSCSSSYSSSSSSSSSSLSSSSSSFSYSSSSSSLSFSSSSSSLSSSSSSSSQSSSSRSSSSGAVEMNMQMNIGDVWKDVESLKINIGDVWKNVISIWQNLPGESWKLVFGEGGDYIEGCILVDYWKVTFSFSSSSSSSSS